MKQAPKKNIRVQRCKDKKMILPKKKKKSNSEPPYFQTSWQRSRYASNINPTQKSWL